MSASYELPPPLDEEALLPSQRALRDLANDVITLRPAHLVIKFYGFESSLDPVDVEARLKASSLGDIMMLEGANLLDEQAQGLSRDWRLPATAENLKDVRIRAWRHAYGEGLASVPLASELKDGLYFDYRVDVKLSYKDARSVSATQTISAISDWETGIVLPRFFNNVYSPLYADMGYDGHIQKFRPANSEDEVMDFLGLAREVFVARVEE